MAQDHVDRIVSQWAAVRPDLDTRPMQTLGRINRIFRIAGRSIEATFAELGLTREAFDVLATLRRSGPPYRLNPTQLYQMMMISSGTITNRIDKVERAGWVKRLPDPSDRRGTLIELTPEGLALVDRAVEVDMEGERRLLRALSPEEQEQLADLLRKLLHSLEAEGRP